MMVHRFVRLALAMTFAIRHLLAVAAFGAICAAASRAYATTDFNVECRNNNAQVLNCSVLISDLVTEKFAQQFPADTYAIFLLSDVEAHAAGGYIAYAISGVVARGVQQFPLQRFTVTTTDRGPKADERQLLVAEVETLRDAVRALMNSCDRSPTCDVFSGNPVQSSRPPTKKAPGHGALVAGREPDQFGATPSAFTVSTLR